MCDKAFFKPVNNCCTVPFPHQYLSNSEYLISSSSIYCVEIHTDDPQYCMGNIERKILHKIVYVVGNTDIPALLRQSVLSHFL
jgi:hypothetical protein